MSDPKDAPGYELVVGPNSPIVSVGATQTYCLNPTNFATVVIDQTETVAWTAVKVDVETTEGDDEDMTTTVSLKGVPEATESGTVSWDVTWPSAGAWMVVARLERTDQFFYASQEVVERETIVTRSKVWPNTHEDPHAAADWGRHMLEAAEQLGDAQPDMKDAVRRRHEKQMKDLRTYVEGLDRLMLGVPKSRLSFIRGVWVADVVDDVAEDVVQVRAVLFHIQDSMPGPLWVLVDWTNPTAAEKLCVHQGRAMSHAASIQLAISRWEQNNQYPAGTIEFVIDGLAGYQLVMAADNEKAREVTITTTDSLALLLSDVLGWASMGTFILAVVAVATGVGAVAAPALFAISAGTGAASGAAHIVYLINVGSDNWRAYAFDALSIAGNLLGLRGAGYKLFGSVPIRVGAAKVTKFAVIGEVLVSSAELTLVAESTYKQIEDIQKDKSLTPQEKLHQSAVLVGTAVGSSALLVWSVKQNLDELERLEAFLLSEVRDDPSWRGHLDNLDEEQRAELRRRQKIPDQAMLYRDVEEIRDAAAYALRVIDKKNLSPGKAPENLVEGTHWKAWEGRDTKSGVAVVIQVPDGRMFPGRSDKKVSGAVRKKIETSGGDSPDFHAALRNKALREAYASVHKDFQGYGHAGCAEAFALDDAIDVVGVGGLKGSVADARWNQPNIPLKHGRGLSGCASCQQVFARFGVIDLNMVRQQKAKIPGGVVGDYLAKLGMPGNWGGADEAIKLLQERGFPVSPAAQEMVRLFGTLDTARHPPPSIPLPATSALHGPAAFCVDPLAVSDVSDDITAMELSLGVEQLCPVGYSHDGVGIMAVDPAGRVFFEESTWGYAGAVGDVIVRLLTGVPNVFV